MQADVLTLLRDRRGIIRDRWGALLRVEPVTTPLANPDTLIYLIDPTLDEIFKRFAVDQPSPSDDECGPAENRLECECGRNPFIAFFLAATQAMLEALVLAQAELSPLVPKDRDVAVAELYSVMRELSQRSIRELCSVCQYRRVGFTANRHG